MTWRLPVFASCALSALAALPACNDPPAPTVPSPRSVPPDPGLTCGAPAITSSTPDVPEWRGGCFFAGPAGKIVNGSPSPDVRMFGHACDGTPGSVGGLVYLDNYDPVSGAGDVTVLLSSAGSKPVVVGTCGGAGGIVAGSTGARFNDDGTQLLTLAGVSVGNVSGSLVLVSLLPALTVKPIATGVRVENYDFLPSDAALFVGNYDAARRVGDLFYLPRGGAAQTVVVGAARTEFLVYALSPDRTRVAYLHVLPNGSLRLEVSSLPPATAPVNLDVRASQMSWTADGQRLVYVVQGTDGVTSEVKSWEPATGRVTSLAGGVNASAVIGNDVVYAQGWTVLAPEATLHVAPAGGDAEVFTAAATSLDFGGAVGNGGGSLVAYVTLPNLTDPFTGDLFLAPLPSAPRPVDGGISPGGGFLFSPRAAFVAYAKGFARPQSSGNPSAQPGLARELRIASASGTAFTLASDASLEKVAWRPDEAFVAGIGAFDPGRDSGDLVVKTAAGADPAPQPIARGVSATWFGFTEDGATLAAIRDWDAGLQRGELVAIPTTPGGWVPVPLPSGDGRNATFFLTRGGRVMYGVRGEARDGLWLAP
jgi:hypothetical protein